MQKPLDKKYILSLYVVSKNVIANFTPLLRKFILRRHVKIGIRKALQKI